MLHYEFTQTHYQAGLQQGRALRARGAAIAGSPVFALTDQARRFAAHCLPFYEQYCPQLLQELAGIADGQGTERELLCHTALCIYCAPPQNHCTCFAFAGAQGPVFGRNSDFLAQLAPLNSNCLYRLEGAYPFLANTTAFVQMEDGINSQGLAVGLTFVCPRELRPGLNAGMMLRLLLERCATTGEAVDLLRELPAASSQTFTLADRAGSLAVVEKAPAAFALQRPRPGQPYLAAVNHFYTEALSPYNPPAGFDDWRSAQRYATARRALKEHPNGDAAFAQALLAGEYGFLCQKGGPAGADTVWSVVYDLGQGRIYRAEGNPSRTAFAEDKRLRLP